MALKESLTRLLRPLARRLPAALRAPLTRWWYAGALRWPFRFGYGRRRAQERTRFATEEVVNDLPPIFVHWSLNYLQPRLRTFGFASAEEFFAQRILQAAHENGRPPRIVSLGAGNCDSEIAVAQTLQAQGLEAFRFECLDLTPDMLQRGRALAAASGLAAQFTFVRADFNHWRPAGHYDVVIANQSLHHVVRLEALFDAIAQAIGANGVLLVSDTVGRNGHQRWPEALALVQEFWRELPESYRYNVQLRRHEAQFGNWDCAQEGFEGIRAQDILPLLVQRFGFAFFYAYANLVDPFIDRSFGPHFDPARDWDCDFIARVQARDEQEIEAGRIKPTHLLAALRNARDLQPQVWRHLTPAFCLRPPDAAAG